MPTSVAVAAQKAPSFARILGVARSALRGLRGLRYALRVVAVVLRHLDAMIGDLVALEGADTPPTDTEGQAK